MAILGRMDKPETPQEPNESEQPRLHHLDARSLRGLAHPLRMRLLSALRRGGPATASQLAEKLGESSGATSYHLRQLAAHPAALIHSAAHGTSQLARELVSAYGEDHLRSLPSAKTAELVEYLSPIVHGQGDKAVVFSQFGPSVLPLLAEALRKEGIRSYLYTGGMDGTEREQARRSFRSDPDPCVFLTSDAGKDGINLPEATYLVEYESALTYETRTQRLGRIDRITSTAPSITCTTFVLQGTVEEGIVDSMLKRNEMADHFLDDSGADGHVGAQQRRRSYLVA